MKSERINEWVAALVAALIAWHVHDKEFARAAFLTLMFFYFFIGKNAR